jgi:hypothetical protein
MTIKQFYFFILIGSLFFSSCKKQEDKTSWGVDVLAPLATTSLSLSNLVKDSTIRTNSDNSLTLDYRTTIYELSLADQFVKIPDTTLRTTLAVTGLALGRTSIYFTNSLGAIGRTAASSSDPNQIFLGNFILNNQGNTKAIPPINSLSPGAFVFDASSYFKSVSLTSGYLDFWVVNHLPIQLDNLNYEVRNTIGNDLIFSGTIPTIAPYDSVYRSEYLTNKHLESSLKFNITGMSSPGTGSNAVKIDTNDYIGLNAKLHDLRVSDAIARFPSQDLIGADQEITQDLGDRRFSYVDCKDGFLTIEVKSSVQETIHLKYRLKGAFDKFGQPLEKISEIPPATAGNPSVVSQTFPINGYAINLTGSNGSKFNTYTQVINAVIDSSGIERHISSDDSLIFSYKISGIRPNYIKGYVGRDTVNIKGDSPFDFTNMFKNSAPNALKFENVKMSLSIENGLGVDGNVKINNLSGINANGNSVALSDFSSSPIIGTTQHINRATDFPLTPAVSNFVLQSASSNINDFISNLPNKISYDVQIKTNPSGNRNTYDDFAYLESRLKVNLDINMPLSLLANNLILKDSFGFSLGSSTKEIDNIKDGTLHLITQNKFPIQSDIELLVFDENWNLLDSLVSNARVDAADLNGACRAEVAKKNVLNIPLSGARLEKVKSSKHAVVTAIFNTKATGTCNGQYLKIYSDYKLDAKITADFNYKVKF